MTNMVVAYARFLYILSTDDMGLESFERTDILLYSILAACLLPKPPIELIALLVNLFILERATLPIIASEFLYPSVDKLYDWIPQTSTLYLAI